MWFRIYKVAVMTGLWIGAFNGFSRTYRNSPDNTQPEEECQMESIDGDRASPAMSESRTILSKTKDYVQNTVIDGVIGATYVAILPITLPFYGIYVMLNSIK
jgi:hypothetical protein